MSAILVTKGPAVTYESLKNEWSFLDTLTYEEYLSATKELEMLELGSVASLFGSHCGVRNVFIKRLPFTARDTLKKHSDLCSPELYSAKFSQPSSFPQNLRDRLVSMGLVSKVLFG